MYTGSTIEVTLISHSSHAYKNIHRARISLLVSSHLAFLKKLPSKFRTLDIKNRHHPYSGLEGRSWVSVQTEADSRTLKHQLGFAHGYSSVVLCQALVGARVPQRHAGELESSA